MNLLKLFHGHFGVDEPQASEMHTHWAPALREPRDTPTLGSVVSQVLCQTPIPVLCSSSTNLITRRCRSTVDVNVEGGGGSRSRLISSYRVVWLCSCRLDDRPRKDLRITHITTTHFVLPIYFHKSLRIVSKTQ